MKPKNILILNPAAGKGTAGKKLPLLEKQLSAHGFDYELHLTKGPNDAIYIAREAAESGAALVVAAGGDGTINEVINGLMTAKVNGNGRPALGVLPIGRGNDFAYGVDIPCDLREAVEILAQGRRRTIDVGRVIGGDFPDGRFFGNGVGIGFDTVVGFEAAKIQWLQGAASYLVAVIRTIFLYSSAQTYQIIINEEEPYQKEFLMVSIMNGSRMGGAFHMAPDSHPGDGALDVCLAGHVSQIKILPLAAKFIQGSQKEHPAVRMKQAQSIHVKAIHSSIPAHADGETICTAGQELRIDLHKAALDVIAKSI